MGGLFGKPSVISVNAVNDVINSSILKLASNTQSTNNVSQYIEADNGSTVSGNTQSVDVKTNMNSVLSATQNSDFNTTVKNDVQQSLEKKSVALLGAFDSLLQNQNVDLKTDIGSKLSNLNLQDLAPICMTNNNISQSIIAKRGSTITNNSQIVKADFIQSCTTLATNNMNTTSDIANSINQRAKLVTENPLNFLTDMFKGGITMVIIVIIVIVGGFIVLIGPGKVDPNLIITKGIDKAASATKVLPLLAV